MRIKKLIKKLKKLEKEHGNLEVLTMGANCDIPSGILSAKSKTCDDDSLEEYRMPEGFKYIEISAW